MKIEGLFVFENTGYDAVWAFLTDPDHIAGCLPGCEKLTAIGDGTYEIAMSIGIGSIRGKFTGSIRLQDVNPKTDYAMAVSGSGAPGFVNAAGQVRLCTEGNDTRVEYSGVVNAGGPIASVGQRMISGAARMLIDQFFRCMKNALNFGNKDLVGFG